MEGMGQSKGEQEVGDPQEQFLLLFQPGLCIFVLAFGAMAVAAGVITVLQLLTLWTAIDLSTQDRSAAVFNRPHGLEMVARHAAGILLAIGRSITAENIRQF